MPNVGLFSASEPLSEDTTVSIRYTVEVEGLPVYTELYDVRKLAEELMRERDRAVQLWTRRLEAPVAVLREPLFSAKLTAMIHEP
jgi:hypothetical protein